MRRTKFRYPVTTLVGSTLKNIFALHRSHHVEPKYQLKYILSCAVAGILEPLNLAERIIWQKQINNFRPEQPPVFIIGFWRSGTTLLHNLLCQDPKASYTNTLQTVFPNLVLTQSWWLKPFTNHFLPSRRPYENVKWDMDVAQEEDFGMMNLQPSTIYKFFIYPTEYDRILEEELYTAALDPEKLALWKKSYRNMMAKASFNTGGKRYIGKNPCHLTRLGLLKDMFPDAKFIFIHRHPYKVIESLYRFMHTIFPGVQLQDVPEDFTREKVVRLYKKSIETYFRDRAIIPASDLYELRMDDFLSDIMCHLNKIYDRFGLGDFQKVAPLMEKYCDENPAPDHTSHSPHADTIRLVDQYAGEIMGKLGYSS